MNKVLLIKAFGLKDGKLFSAFDSNPLARTYNMFEQVYAPEDFPFYFVSDLEWFLIGTDYSTLVACEASENDVKVRDCPFLINASRRLSLEQARGYKNISYSRNLTATSFRPLGVLWHKNGGLNHQASIVELKVLSKLSGIPIYKGYEL